MQHQSIKRRDFLKWSGIAGGAAMLAPSLLVGCSPQQEPLSQTSDAPDTSGYIMDAVSDGLPYGADKICPVMCTNGDACGQLHCGAAYVKDGAIIHYEGSCDAFNKGAMCARGMSGFDIINHPDRIKYPMRRTNEKGVVGEFERISWEEALDEIASAAATAIREEGPHTIASGWAHPGSFALLPCTSIFNKLFGSDQPLLPDCWFDLQFGPVPTVGDMYHALEEDPYESKVIVLWGENTSVTKPQEWSDSYGKAKNEFGAKLVVIDSRLTETALKADIFIPVRPGTDAYVAMAMANVIIDEGLTDQDFIGKHTFGYEEFAELAKKYTPEEVEKVSWAPADKIREVARLYATSKPSLIAIGRGGNSAGGEKSNAGWLMSRAICCLPGLCGQFGVKGSGISIETSSACPSNTIYHWPAAKTMASVAASLSPLVERKESAPAGIWGQKEILYNRKPYGYRVYITNGNFASSSGNTKDADAAFKAIDMVVVHNRFMHWTASAYADIVLPVTSWAEQYVWRPDWEHIAVTEPAIEPMFECKSDTDTYRELSIALANKLELGLADEDVWPWKGEKDLIAATIANDGVREAFNKCIENGQEEYSEYLDISIDTIIEHPDGVRNPFFAGQSDFVPYKAKLYKFNSQVPASVDDEEIWFPTDGGTGKLLFKADFLAEYSDGVLPALPIPEEPEDSYYLSGNPIESGDWQPSEAVSSGFELVAVGRAHKPWQFLSFNQDKNGGPISSLIQEAFDTASTPCVEINPVDATRFGIENGDPVTVESRYGAMESVQAIVSEVVQPGTIVPPYHWGKIQNNIYPTSRSFTTVAPDKRTQLLPPFVGEYGTDKRRGSGGINNQTGVLCKVYKA